MVKIDNFIIALSRENGVYFPGEEITGNLLIKARERQKINSVFLEFKGESYVHWTENRGTGQNRRTETYCARETIFESKQFLMQKQPNGGDLYLENYECNLPFRFNLPPSGLPTSYEHHEAHIKYSVKATIDIPWAIDKHNIRCFTIINPLDLNLISGLMQPYGVSDVKTICCGPCKSDPITIEFNTNKTGYVPGETIVFNASIDNRSTQTIKSISASLIQRTRFIAIGSTRPYNNNIVTLTYDGQQIGPRMFESWSNVKIKIPTVCPSLLETCRIIKLEYVLTLVVNTKALSVNKNLDIPIVIGTVALNDSASANPTIKYYKSILDGKANNNQNQEEEEANEESRLIVENNENIRTFKPRYPYYKDLDIR